MGALRNNITTVFYSQDKDPRFFRLHGAAQSRLAVVIVLQEIATGQRNRHSHRNMFTHKTA